MLGQECKRSHSVSVGCQQDRIAQLNGIANSPANALTHVCTCVHMQKAWPTRLNDLGCKCTTPKQHALHRLVPPTPCHQHEGLYCCTVTIDSPKLPQHYTRIKDLSCVRCWDPIQGLRFNTDGVKAGAPSDHLQRKEPNRGLSVLTSHTAQLCIRDRYTVVAKIVGTL